MTGSGYLAGSSNGSDAVLEEFDDSTLQIKDALLSSSRLTLEFGADSEGLNYGWR